VAAEAGVAKTRRETTTEAPVVEGSRTNDTVVVRRVQKKRDLRLVVMAAVGICVAIAVTAIALLMAQPQGDTVEHAAPAHESVVDLKDTASSPVAASPSAPTQERPERTLTRSGSAHVDVGPRQQPKPGAPQNAAARPVVQPTAQKSPAPASSAKRRPGFDPDRPWWGED